MSPILLLSPARGMQEGTPREKPSAFEVASVKYVAPMAVHVSQSRVTFAPERAPIKYSGQRLSFRFTLFGMLQEAYRLDPDEVLGPDWLHDGLYQVDAIMPPGTSKADSPQMIRTLLEERFALKCHRERRDLPVSTLVVGKRGFALREVPNAGKRSTAFGSGSDMSFFRGHEISIDVLAAFLTSVTGRRVIDQTGLKGLYNIDLSWVPDRDGESSVIDRAAAPAVERRLGLELLNKTSPYEVLVVDHIDKMPTEN
jgi:uncharacterized protein (TIGR03435 family)